MEFLYLFLLLPLSLLFIFVFGKTITKPDRSGKLPPGSTGWPIVGESFQFLAAGWKGHPEKFIFERISKYSSYVYRTNLMLEPVVVLCGASAHKFLFANEGKLVQSWCPSSVNKIFPSLNHTSSKEEAIKMRKMLPNFFKPVALKDYIGIMDTIAQRHFAGEWENKNS